MTKKEDEIFNRQIVHQRIQSVRIILEGFRDFFTRLEQAMVELDRAMGYQTGPESSREEMSPKLNGTLDCPSVPVAPASSYSSPRRRSSRGR